MVAGFDVVGKMMRCTEYRMYRTRAVLMGVPRSNEKVISCVLVAVKKSLASKIYEWVRERSETRLEPVVNGHATSTLGNSTLLINKVQPLYLRHIFG